MKILAMHDQKSFFLYTFRTKTVWNSVFSSPRLGNLKSDKTELSLGGRSWICGCVSTHSVANFAVNDEHLKSVPIPLDAEFIFLKFGSLKESKMEDNIDRYFGWPNPCNSG